MHFCSRPEAVLLQGSTEEVQSVVKACNRFKIKFKAHSTGWGVWGAPSDKGMILLDMRRMNRILDIDEENLHAVVESYVVCAQLQAEAMKKGLNCNIIGAGSSTSVLASCTSVAGCGPPGLTMSYNNRNLLGVEWVLPSGEILRLGSLSSGGGWFCGHGPGPSMRGIARGIVGAFGSLGVFTRCAVKLHPWPGPAVMPIEGVTPNYGSPLPETFKAHTLAFPNWESYADAFYKIGEAEIGYCLCKQIGAWGREIGPAYYLTQFDPKRTLDDLEDFIKTPEIQNLNEELKYSFQFNIAARSLADLEYQEEALKEILEETGGHIVDTFAAPEIQKLMNINIIKADRMNLVFNVAGSFGSSFGSFTNPDASVEAVKVGEAVKRKHIEKGKIVDDGSECMWGAQYEHGLMCHHEEIVHYDPKDSESCQASLEYILDATGISIKKGWGPGGLGVFVLAFTPGPARDSFMSAGPMVPFLRFQKKIRDTFDPNGATDSLTYFTGADE